MFRFVQFSILIGLVLGVALPLRAFELKPVEEIPGFEDYSTYLGQLKAVAESPEGRPPEKALAFKGDIRMGDRMVFAVLWCGGEEDLKNGKWQMVVSTKGRMETLDSEPVLTADPESHKATMQTTDFWGRDVPFAIAIKPYLFESQQWVNVHGGPAALYFGRIRMGDVKRDAVLIDGNGDGLLGKDRYHDQLFIDVDGDGRFAPAGGLFRTREGQVGLNADFPTIMQRVWHRTIDNTIPSVSLVPYEGPVGRLAIRNKTGGAAEIEPTMVCLYTPDDPNNSTIRPFENGADEVLLPSGEYELQYATAIIPARKGGVPLGLILRRRKGTMRIEADKTLEWAMREPLGVKPLITDMRPGQIVIECAYTGFEGVSAVGVQAPSNPPAAHVRVYRGEVPKGRPISTTPMDYG